MPFDQLYPTQENNLPISHDPTVGSTEGSSPFTSSVSRMGNSLPFTPDTGGSTSKIPEMDTAGQLHDNNRYAMFDPNKTESDYAYGQSGWNRVANAGTQLVNKFGSYLLQTAGFLGGAVTALVGGTVNEMDKWSGGNGKVVSNGNAISNMTDNFIVQLADAWKEKVQEVNPIYKTDKYTNGNIWDKLSTTSWWLDDAVDRLALTAACIVPGMLEAKGVGLFGTVAREGGALETTGIGAKAIKTIADNPEMYGKLGRILGSSVYKEAAGGTVDLAGGAITNNFKNIIKAGQYAELVTFNTIGQNALNARESQTAIRKELTEQRTEGLNQLTDAEIENKAADGAREGFLYNLPLTLLSSAFELPQIFSSMKGAQNFLKGSMNVMRTEGVEAGLEAAGKEILKPSLWKVGGKALLTGFEHGQLESSQVAIGRAIEETIAGKRVDGKVVKAEDNMLLESAKDFIGNFSDANGQNNIALGTIQGMLTTIFGHGMKMFKGEFKEEQAHKDSFISALKDAQAGRREFNGMVDMLERNDQGHVVFENGKPKMNQEKLAQAGISYVDALAKHAEYLQYVKENDITGLEYANHKSLAQLANSFFQDANGMEYLENVLKYHHKVAKEAGDSNVDVVNGIEKTPDAKLQDSLSFVKQLKQAHSAIEQRHAGFLNLDVNYADKDEANRAATFTESLKHLQYMNAAEQLFYRNKLQANQSEMASLVVDKSKLWVEEPNGPEGTPGKQLEKFPTTDSMDETRYNELVDENKHIQNHYENSKNVYKLSIDRNEINAAWLTEKAKLAEDKKKAEDIKTESAKTPEQKAEEAAVKPKTIKLTTKDGEQEFEIGKEYFTGKQTDLSKEGKEVYRFPKFTILGENEDGTIKIKDSKTGNERDISKSALEDHKITKVSAVTDNKTANFYMNHMNEVYQYNFGKEGGGKRQGRLQYVDGKLFFVYKDSKGVTKEKQVDNSHFTSQEGFKDARLKKVTTLIAETVEQKTSREEFTSAKALAETKADKIKLEEKLAERRRIIKEVSDETRKSVDEINKKIAEKQVELEKINQELIDYTNFKGEGVRKQNIGIKEGKTVTLAFNKVVRQSLKGLAKLSGLRQNIEQEIVDLQNQKEELEFNLSYFEDFASNLNEMPEKLSEMIKELESQITDIKELTKFTVEQIGLFHKMIKSIDNTIKDFIDYAKSLFSKFDNKYPSYLKDSFERMLAEPNNVLAESQTIKDYLIDLAEVNETNEVVEVDKGKIKDLQNSITNLQEELKELDKVQSAKEEILKTFQKAIQEEIKRKAEEEIAKKTAAAMAKAFGKPEQGEAAGTPVFEFSTDDNKKRISDIASTSTPSGEVNWTAKNPDHKKVESFLSKAESFPNRENLKMVMVTADNEASLHLTGLIDRALDGFKEKRPAETVVAVYMEQNGEDYSFVDENGKAIKDGEHTLDNIVFSLMNSEEETNSNTEKKYGAATDLVNKWTKWYKGMRTKWFGAAIPMPYDFTISAGIAQKYTGKEQPRNAVTKNLVLNHDDLGNRGLIQISSNGAITVGDISRKYKSGRPILVIGNSSVFLNNRNFTDKEANMLFESFLHLSKTPKGEQWNPSVIKYIRSLMFFGDPTTGEVAKDAGRNQFWIDKDGYLNIGKNEFHTRFTEANLLTNKEIFLNLIKGAYNNASKSLLQENAEYEEVIGFKEGIPQTRLWKSYQHYLLSDKYDLVEGLDTEDIAGKVRSENEIPLTNNLHLYDEESKTGPFKQKYSTIIPQEDELNSMPKPKEEVPEIPIEKPKPQVKKVANQKVTQATTKTDAGRIIVEGSGFVGSLYEDIDKMLKRLKGNFIRYGEALAPDEKAAYLKDGSIPNFFLDYLAAKVKEGEKLSTLETEFYVNNKEEVDGFVSGKLKSYFESTPNIIDEETEIETEKTEEAPAKLSVKERALSILNQESKPSKEDNLSSDLKPIPGLDGLRKIAKSNDISEHRLAGPLDVERITEQQWNDFSNWMRKSLPQVAYDRVNHLIDVLGTDRQAWGVFTRDGILVYDKAEVGTQYHEAFEAVWNSFVTDKEQRNLLNEFRQRKGSFYDRETGEKISFSQATLHQAKEAMADDFADFKATQVMPKESGNKIIKFFRDLYNFLKTWITKSLSKEYKAQSLFKAIDTGKFSQAQSVREFTGRANKLVPLTTDLETREIVEDISANVAFVLLNDKENNGLFFGYKKTAEDKISAKKLYDAVKEQSYKRLAAHVAFLDAEEAKGGAARTIARRNQAKVARIYGIMENYWDDIVDINKEFLMSAFKLKIKDGEVTIDEKENQDKNAYNTNAFLEDTKRNSSAAIKLLFATLVEADKSGALIDGTSIPKAEKNSYGGYKLVNASKAFIDTLKDLSNTNTLSEMMSKLYVMGQNNPNYVRLYRRLSGNLDAKGEILWNTVTIDDLSLLTDFYTTFAKQAPTPFIVNTSDTGETYMQPADLNSVVNSKIDSWMYNLKTLAKKGNEFIKKESIGKNGKLTGYSIKVNKEVVFAGNSKDVIKNKLLPMLEKLGVTIDKSTINKFNGVDAKDFKEAAESFLLHIKADKAARIEKDNLGIRLRLTQMADIVIKNSDTEQKSVYYNHENESRQLFVNDNFYSKFSNSFNTINTLDEFKEANPQYNDVLLAHSTLLERGGVYFKEDGTRTKVKLDIGYIDGMLNNNRPKSIDDFTTSDRLLTSINGMLGTIKREDKGFGWYNLIMPGDSATEWMIKMKNAFNFTDFFSNTAERKVSKIFLGYLQDEMALIADADNRVKTLNSLKNPDGSKKENGFRLLNGILSDKLKEDAFKQLKEDSSTESIAAFAIKHEAQLTADVMAFFKVEAESIKNVLKKEGKLINSSEGKYSIKGLDTGFAREEKFVTEKKNDDGEDILVTELTEKQVDNLALSLVANLSVANTEIVKNIFGDVNNFKDVKDMLKRVKSFGSPRKSILADDNANKWMNDHMNNAGKVKLTSGEYGYTNFDNKVTTVTINNFEVLGLPALQGDANYDKVDRSDAQMWAMPTFYREVMKKSGLWSPEMDRFFDYDSAMARQYIASIDEVYGKRYNANKELQKADEELIKKGPGDVKINVIKPIITGQKLGVNYMDTMLDKTSAFPLFFTHLPEDSHIREHFVQNFKNGVDYSIVPSGRKVGTQGVHDFYTPSGKVNTKAYAEDTKFVFPITNFGIQQETAPHEGEANGVRGTQITKEATLNQMDGGVPIDYKSDVDVTERFSEWNDLSEDNKKSKSEIYKNIVKNNELLDSLTNDGYSKLLKKLGVKEVGTGNNKRFIANDPSKLHDVLYSEILSRENNDNVIDSVKINKETGKFNIAFEASNNYQMIKNILLSIVDKNVVSPSINGGGKIQLSSALWDTDKTLKPYIKTKDGWKEVADYDKLTNEDKSKVRLFSTALKSYSKNADGTINPTEILLPHWFGDKFRKLGKTDKEILELLNSEEGKKILRGIGFRIPTQELNSMEVFTVKGFLPQTAGDTVVVPAEITKKAGSDFDVDKLNTYLKNVYIDSKGNVKLIPYLDTEEATKKALSKIFFDKISDEIDEIENKLVGIKNLQDTASTIALGEASQKAVNKWMPRFDKMFGKEATIYDIEESLMNESIKKGKRLAELSKEDVTDAMEAKFIEDNYTKSLQNAYIESLENIILTPSNYDRLIKPNNNNEMEDLRNELVSITGSENITSTSPLLSLAYINNQRQLSILGKSGVGIGALAQANHALLQRGNVIIKSSRVEKAKENGKAPESFLGDGSIKLTHNQVSLDGELYTTLSGRLDKAGQYISDKLSAYINGFVDIMKDTFLIELGVNKSTAGTFIFLERIGVPTDKVIWFMNQPIIKEYQKMLVRQNSTYLYNKDNIDVIMNMFPVNDLSITQDNLNLNEDNLKINIEKYYKDKESFNTVDNAQQQLVFNEFLKYSTMANHLREYMQALTWDTANFSDFALIKVKQLLMENIERDNIFTSPTEIMGKTFLGNLRNRIEDSNGALGSYMKLQSGDAQVQIAKVLEPLINPRTNYLPTKAIIKLGNKVTASFLDYLVQTELKINGLPLNSYIQRFLTNESTDTAHKLKAIQDDKANPLNENYAIKQLRYHFGNQVGEANNITLKLDSKDTFTQNLFINSLKAIKDADAELYREILLTAIVQSGTYKSSISFTDLLPLEDFASLINPIINSLDERGNFSTFGDKNLFLRNNWGVRDGFVTQIPELRMKKDGSGFYNQVALHSYYYADVIANLKRAGITDDNMPIMISTYTARGEMMTVKRINHREFTDDQIKAFKAQKDYNTFKEVVGYQLVKDIDGTPLLITEEGKDGNTYTKLVYKPINLYGDGQYAQEYYNDVRPSILKNGTRPIQEVTDNSVFFKAFAPKMENKLTAEEAKVVSDTDKVVSLREEISSLENAKVLSAQEKLQLNILKKDLGKLLKSIC